MRPPRSAGVAADLAVEDPILLATRLPVTVDIRTLAPAVQRAFLQYHPHQIGQVLRPQSVHPETATDRFHPPSHTCLCLLHSHLQSLPRTLTPGDR